MLVCAAYAITLVSLIYVAEFFDYTDDFADNSVTSIGMTFISAAIVAGPPLKQYNLLCEYIKRYPRLSYPEIEECKQSYAEKRKKNNNTNRFHKTSNAAE